MISKPTGLYPDNEAISLGNCLESTVNIFTSQNCTMSSKLTSDGQVKRDTTADSYGRRCVTDFINVQSDTRYKIAGYLNTYETQYNAWYDKDKKFISSFARSSDQVITSPKNAVYIRLTYYETSGAQKLLESDSLSMKAVPRYKNGLTLLCQVQSNSSIETFMYDGSERAYAMLILWDKDRYYHFCFGDSLNAEYAPRVIHGDYTTEIKLELSENGVSGGYYYPHKDNPVSDISLFNIIRSGKRYSWKLRLYEKGSLTSQTNYAPSATIGYGTVQDITSVYNEYNNNSASNVISGYTFKIFPHLNIYDDVVERTTTSGGSNIFPADQNSVWYSQAPEAVVNTIYNVMKNRDKNIHYWLDTDGYILPIEKYRFYPYRYRDAKDHTNTGLVYSPEKDNSCFDAYGNPLSGYAVINSKNDALSLFDKNSEDDTLANLSNEFVGETYKIRTNYIDSNWAYFDLCDEPKITMSDNNGSEVEDRTTSTLDHSSINLNMIYSQSQGAVINYYSYKIYCYDKDSDEYILDYYSGNLYNQDLRVVYDKLFNDQTYKVYICMVDNNQRVYERTVFYKTCFPETDYGLIVCAEYYSPHNSVIIDWSSNNDIAADDIVGYRVYKKIGNSNKLYEIANLTSDDSCIIEDFIVGDNCEYTYYVYPIIAKDKKTTIAAPAISEPIKLEAGIDKVVGLNKIGDKVYEVAYDQVWRLYLNLDDSGYTYNTDKNFYDTFNTYNQETVGNRKYITKPLSGMLGYVDCASQDEGIVDTYDMLVSWNEFSGSANLKCLIDARGLILPGNFEANPSVEYMDAKGSPATAKFSWRQTSDLNIIKIYATVLPFNPLDGTYIKSSDEYYLSSAEPKVLYTSK